MPKPGKRGGITKGDSVPDDSESHRMASRRIPLDSFSRRAAMRRRVVARTGKIERRQPLNSPSIIGASFERMQVACGKLKQRSLISELNADPIGVVLLKDGSWSPCRASRNL